ncbi:hypothetical protein BC828DRAFT_371927 [Blastocladiella britannica]|nr:hypothetical protein BC828DRAFT_371927 [Blastocladiella britannica]
MAEELSRKLKLSTVSAADKLALATGAVANRTLRIPKKAELLADWCINTQFKSRTWPSQEFAATPILCPAHWRLLAQLVDRPSLKAALETLKAPLFSLLATSISHVPAHVTDADQLASLWTEIAHVAAVVLPALQPSQKITVDAWASLAKAACGLLPNATASTSTDPVASLVEDVLNTFAKVLAVTTPAAKCISAACALFPSLWTLPQTPTMHAAAINVLRHGLFGKDTARALAFSLIQLIEARIAEATAAANGSVQASIKRSRKATGATSSPGLFSIAGKAVGLFPSDLVKVLRAVPAAERQIAFAAVQTAALQQLVTATAETTVIGGGARTASSWTFSLLWLTVQAGLVSLVDGDYSVQSTLLVELAAMDSMPESAHRVHIAEDREDLMVDTLRYLSSSAIEDIPSQAAFIERFLLLARISTLAVGSSLSAAVSAVVVQAAAAPQSCSDAITKLVEIYAGAKSLNVLMSRLAKELVSSSSAIAVLADPVILQAFSTAVASATPQAWFEIVSSLLELFSATPKAHQAIVSTYFAVAMDHVPSQPSMASSRETLATILHDIVRAVSPSPAIIHLHTCAFTTLAPYTDLWTAASAHTELAKLVESACKSHPWIGLGAGFQVLDHPETKVIVPAVISAVSAALLAFGPKSIRKSMGDWSGVFWEATGQPEQAVYWWMIVVQYLDAFSVFPANVQQNIATIFTQCVPSQSGLAGIGASTAAYSIPSITHEALYSADFYELQWLRPHLVTALLAANAHDSLSTLQVIPAAYFPQPERVRLADRLLAPIYNNNKTATVSAETMQMVERLVLALDAPTSTNVSAYCALLSSPLGTDGAMHKHFLAKLGHHLLSDTSLSDDARADALTTLLANPRWGPDAIFTWRIVLDWASAASTAEKGAARLVLVSAAFECIGDSSNAGDLAVWSFKVLIGVVADPTLEEIQATVATVLADTSANLDPLVLRALEQCAARMEDAEAFTALYAAALDAPTSSTSVSNWLAVAHVLSVGSPRQGYVVKKQLRHVLMRMQEKMDLIVHSLDDLLSALRFIERLMAKVPRLSPRTLNQVLLLLLSMLSFSSAQRFYKHVDAAALTVHNKEELFQVVADVLAAVLQHQRRALVASPVMFTVMLRDLLLCFLEPGRYAHKAVVVTPQGVEAASPIPCLPLAVLTTLAPFPSTSAWAWHRLLHGIAALPAPVLIALQGAPSSRVVAPIGRHLPFLVAEYAAWAAFAAPSSHPRFGWALVAEPKARAAITRGVYEALDLVGDSGRIAVLDMVPNAAKQSVKDLVADYNKYHKYQGKA